jgi:membrane protein DedA with SNARE-associated domain/rhodanese-related sulfurtransferase
MDDLFNQFGLPIVFCVVFLEQLGLPIPAEPILIGAGALSVSGQFSAIVIFLIAFAASTISDTLWYLAGRKYGQRVVELLCKVSLSPDYCVRETEIGYQRWGRLTLILGKFLPGISTVARPLAGAMKMEWTSFLLLNGIGTMLWISAGLIAGIFFHVQVLFLIEYLDTLGVAGAEMLATLFIGYVAIKWVRRRHFYNQLRIARISVDELLALIARGNTATIIDVRSPTIQQVDPRFIPGALVMDIHTIENHLHELPTEQDIVFYCSCPNDASAAFVAQKLIDRGYTKVRPLHGGLNAWIDAGHAVEVRLSKQAPSEVLGSLSQ